LPEAAAAEGLEPLAYMRRYGAFQIPYAGQQRYEADAAPAEAGVDVGDGARKSGFKTPSRLLEIYSPTLEEWGWPEHSVPGYIRSQVHWRELDESKGEMVLLPTFRLPTLIHTRSGNSKWLQEISHTNPLWLHPEDAGRIGVSTGDLVRVCTAIGYFVPRVWVTEGIHPGIAACSHHVGRWRMHREIGGGKLATTVVDLDRDGDVVTLRQREGVAPFDSADRDTNRIWWHEAGVNQNLTFPVQPDPVSGMHCWHQKIVVEPAHPDDRFSDVQVDLAKSRAAYEKWLAMARPAPGPGGLRRPLWLNRPLHPAAATYRLGDD
jgi:anaerobic selenocysteine-containing dehydrogenase